MTPETSKLVIKWQKYIENALNLDENTSVYGNMQFEFVKYKTKKDILATIIHFYLNYVLDFRDVTKDELKNIYTYYLKEVGDELKPEEQDSIRQRMQDLFETFYYDEVPKKIENKPPQFEID
jgi:6-pyruvoyl-tetrahydropterin synthase